VESRVTKLRRFTTSPALVGRLEFFGADAAKVAVTPSAIVECIDVVSDVRQRGVTARVDPLLDALLLQAAEEGLDHGIVPAVALAAHARLEVIGAAEAPPGVTTELHALIGVNDGAARPPLLYRRCQCVQDQFAVDRRASGPPDDLPGEQIDDDGEVEPPLPRPDVRDVRRPGRVALRRRELALEQVRSQHRRLADLPAARAIAVQRPQPVFSHQAGHTMHTTRLARLAEVEEHARRPVDALACLEGRADQSE
jgi:hypothetical protein